jgi:hypothetical protein
MDADEWRKMTDVREGEFELGDEGVYHVPTGAMFWTHPESTTPFQIDWGKAHDTDEDNAPLYDTGWIVHVAELLLKQRQGST